MDVCSVRLPAKLKLGKLFTKTESMVSDLGYVSCLLAAAALAV